MSSSTNTPHTPPTLRPCPGRPGQGFCGQEKQPGQGYCSDCRRAYQRDRHATMRQAASLSYTAREHTRASAAKCNACKTTPPSGVTVVEIPTPTGLDGIPTTQVNICDACAAALVFIDEYIGLARVQGLTSLENLPSLVKHYKNPGVELTDLGKSSLTRLTDAHTYHTRSSTSLSGLPGLQPTKPIERDYGPPPPGFGERPDYDAIEPTPAPEEPKRIITLAEYEQENIITQPPSLVQQLTSWDTAMAMQQASERMADTIMQTAPVEPLIDSSPLPQRLSGPPTGNEPLSMFGDEDNW